MAIPARIPMIPTVTTSSINENPFFFTAAYLRSRMGHDRNDFGLRGVPRSIQYNVYNLTGGKIAQGLFRRSVGFDVVRAVADLDFAADRRRGNRTAHQLPDHVSAPTHPRQHAE